MVLQNKYCKKCGEVYTNMRHEWCKPCQINHYLKKLIIKSNENKKIDDLIQEMQSQINEASDKIFEWIPYEQFVNIKEVGEGRFAKVYSAKWKDGPLMYDIEKHKYIRIPGVKGVKDVKDVKVALKCLKNLKDIDDGFLNEVKKFKILFNFKL
jgi:hypothetical protein